MNLKFKIKSTFSILEKENLVLLLILFLNYNSLTAQNLGINSTGSSPNSSAALDIDFTNKGLLIPRIALTGTTDVATILTPATSLLVYNTVTVSDVVPGYYYYNGSAWESLSTGGGSANNWALTGNAGTNSSTNFFGTTDNSAIVIKTNNVKSGIIDPAGPVFLGYNAGLNNSSTTSMGIGFEALYSNTTGIHNTANGYRALYNNTTGYENTANGQIALYTNANGSKNTAIGVAALYSNTTGSKNTAFGNRALALNTIGYENTANGFEALFYNTSGSSNTANGFQALFTSGTGVYNTASGATALYWNTSGHSNTAKGYQALYNNSEGYNNVAVGFQSLFYNTTGDFNTSIGTYTGPNSVNLNNTTAVGNSATTTASNQMRFGNGFVTSIGGQVGWTTISDGRMKENIKEEVPGLAFITSLRPVTYTLNTKKFDEFMMQQMPDSIKASRLQHEDAYQKSSSILRTGFIAQEVEAAAKQAGFSFDGVDVPKNEFDLYGLRYAEFVVPLVKAVQEQQVIIMQQQIQFEEQYKKLTNQQKQIDDQQQINGKLQLQLNEIQKQLNALLEN